MVPTADDDANSDTENTDDLFDYNPVKLHQSPLSQYRKKNTSDQGTDGSSSDESLVQDIGKHIGCIEQMWIMGEECRQVQNQGAEASPEPGHSTEKMSG